MSTLPQRLPRFFPSPQKDSLDTSLWTASSDEPLIPSQQLSGEASAEVVVIGGGYTGLSTALHLACQGVDVAILEARQPGFGASGRNGGQVVPALRHDPEDLIMQFGETIGNSLIQLVSESADIVFDLIDKFNIQCAPTKGWIQVGNGQASSELLEKRFQQWQQHHAPVRRLDDSKLAKQLGSHYYSYGLFFDKAGIVQPLAYARGLARAAQQNHARIYSHSHANKIEKSGQNWTVHTHHGSIKANHIVIATNGYTGKLWPKLQQTIVPVFSMQVATNPLPESIRQSLMPDIRSAADTNRLVRYFRLDNRGRFIFGNRGPSRHQPGKKATAHAIQQARTIFPQLQGIEFPYSWAGRVAMTADHLPHLHQPESGLWIALGYNGRGVGMATMMGRVLATACMNTDTTSPTPYPKSPIQSIPMHALNRIGIECMVFYYRMRDYLAAKT